ncbi:putative T7SS-secreted protein [Streptomyces sp. NPDC050560]|uniref:putative T7SS-secreted protein n=1 Tax=Streptomyces sp. NPDC050560 TaxID=3365630 RepID=UPI0037BA55CB
MGIFGDIGDGLDKLAGAAEDGWNAAKKDIGEGVDRATDLVGAGLERVGADGVADAVEDWGDEFASDLGATPGERGLGETEEAGELIHGSPAELRTTGGHLRDFHKAFAAVAKGMGKLDSTHWRGAGGDAFRKKFAMHPTKWTQAADACEKAAEALEAFADTVQWAQGRAKDAIDIYKRGKENSDLAVAAYHRRVDAYNAALKGDGPPGPRPAAFSDPGTEDIRSAKDTLREARRQRDDAGKDAAKAVRAALEHAPAEPPPLARIGADMADGVGAAGTELTHLAGGAAKGAAGLWNFVRGVNPLDPYNLTHPADYAQHVNMTLANLTSAVTHPRQTAGGLVAEAGRDPSEFTGRVIPGLLAGGGPGGLLRAGARKGLADTAKDGMRRSERGQARHKADDGPAHARREGVETKGTDPVDLATGTMFLPLTDVALPGVLPLVFRRRAASDSHLGRWFGPSWSSTLDQRLEIDSEGIVLVHEDGLVLAYPHPAPGVPVLPHHGPAWPLDRAPEGGYVVADTETGRTWHFSEGAPDGPEGASGAGTAGADGPRGTVLARLEQIDDRNGNWIIFDHDAHGVPLSLRDSAGHRLRVDTEGGRITALHLAGAAEDGGDQELVRYRYDEAGNLARTVNSSGLPLSFTYDDQSRVTSWTDTNGRGYRYAYDAHGRCVAEGGTAGHMSLRLSYGEPDPATGLRTNTVTTGDGRTRRYLVNQACQVVAETDASGNTTRYVRDHRDRLLSLTDPLGRTTRLTYDDEGNLTEVTRPDGRTRRAVYGAFGLPLSVTDFDGTTTRHSYDEQGNRVAVVDSAGATTRFTHDGAGRPTSVTDALGARTLVRCDRAGLPLELRDPLGGVTRYVRDAFGRPVSVTDATGATTRLEWTVEGNLARRTAPDGTAESWTYDGEGNCTARTDPMGARTLFEYGHFDVLTARTDPDGTRHTFDHDAELRLVRVTGPQGLSWTYAYDDADRLTAETDFDGRTATYAYDASGALTARTTPLGETIRFERNLLGQVTRKDAAGQVTTYAYDLTDRLVRAVGPDTSLTVLRDRHGRLHSETVDGRTVTFAHDLLGRRTGRTTPSGAESAWTYDAAGHRATLTTSGRTLAFDRDAAGRELTRRIGDCAALDLAYDPLGRLTGQSLRSTARGGGPVLHRSYAYRPDGHLIRVHEPDGGDHGFELDAAGRVTAVRAEDWTEHYAYDAAGNQTEASWPDGHPGGEARGSRAYSGTSITRAGGVRYEHDAAGRIVLRQKKRLSHRPDTWHYTWDAEDRLIAVTTPDGTRWRYTYDPLGRRTSKRRLAADGTTTVEQTTFTWDGTTLCEQTTRARDLPHPVSLTWDHDGHHPLAQTERVISPDEVNTRFYAIVTDLVGTPTELVSENGEVAWHTRRTLWGTTTWNTNAETYTPLRFPGQYFDPETGLHHNFFRTYDPETARYLTADPLGLLPGPNPHLYVLNPFRYTDPLGLAPAACPDHLALGTRDEGKLKEFAEGHGFTHFLDQGFDEVLGSVRHVAHEQPHVHLHIVLNGFKGFGQRITDDPAELFAASYGRGKASGGWFTTEREMAMVGDAVKWGNRPWSSITFYMDGEAVPSFDMPDI